MGGYHRYATLAVHAYFDINLDILWRTVQDDLPPLIAELERGTPR